jgi:hypothetical protein
MIKYKIFFFLTLSEIVVLGIFFVYSSSVSMTRGSKHYPDMQQLVSVLQLTDLALWTEARYTRHPSQADLFSPFQDFPSSLEHFPAGSVIGPVRPGYE